MDIQLILADDIPNIAKIGDTVILKSDGTFAITKEFAGYKNFSECEKENKDKDDVESYCGAIKHKVEDTKKSDDKSFESDLQDKLKNKYDPRIEKYLPVDKEKAWQILTKFYNEGHLNSFDVLKELINKVATCPDITEKFDSVMEKWMKDGDANISPIEKIINSCKREGGNIKNEK